MSKVLKYYSLLIVSVSISLLAGCNQNESDPIDSNRTNHDTYVAVGVYDEAKNIIDNGDNINVSNEGKINHIIDLDQNILEDREYLLIAMLDFKQKDFIVEGKKYYSYKFKIEKSGQIKIDLCIDIPEESKELEYIIIKKPNYMPNEDDFDSMIAAQSIMTSRFTLNNNNINKDIHYESNVVESDSEPYDNIWISDNVNELNPIHSVKENTKLYLTIGNENDQHMNYAVVMFSNWEQVKFTDGNLVKYFSVKPKHKLQYDLELPNVDKDAIFQSIAFPLSGVTEKKYSYGSFKFIIRNK